MPVATMSAYISGTAPPAWVDGDLLAEARGLPMTSSAVIARISATAAASRNAGHEIGQRGRPHHVPDAGNGPSP